MSRVLRCDGCEGLEGEMKMFRPGSGIDYCEACLPPAAAFYAAALKSRAKHVAAWRDELVALRAELAPGLKSVAVPIGIDED